MLRVILFFAASAAILPLSWRSLKDLRTHGFYRFFAFELLLGLILLNAPSVVARPVLVRQLVSYRCWEPFPSGWRSKASGCCA